MNIRLITLFYHFILADNEDHLFRPKKKQALLDLLLEAQINGAPLSDTDIREEVDTFMFEGHDTTTSALGFTLLMISKDQRVQQKMLKEINSLLGTIRDGETFSSGDLGQLKYMEMVIKETLRLYPPVAVLGRRIEEEFVLSEYVQYENND